MAEKFFSLPDDGNIDQEIPRELLENPEYGQSAAKPLKEDSNYWILEDGRLYSNKRKRFLSGRIDKTGQRIYILAIKNPLTGKKEKKFYAHRLVAEYFVPNPEPDLFKTVIRKDNSKLNNKASNLEWVTLQDSRYLHRSEEKRTPKYYLSNLEGEVWRTIEENPRYKISNKGRVRNAQTNRLIKINNNQKYSRVSLSYSRTYYLHRLVYCTFNNDYDLNGYVISHKDGDPLNNNLENLEKITIKEDRRRRKEKEEGSTTIPLRE